MLLELCFCMTLHDERREGSLINQMLGGLCFRMRLRDDRGEFNQMLLEICLFV